MDITTSTKEVQKYVEIFCCYARKDQPLLQDLKNHLMPLKREGLITLWADTDINAGIEWEKEIHLHLNTSDIILLLISSDFMASDYCYSIEMKRAMERHESGEARVIPIILRPVHWQDVPFAKLQALPQNAHPISSSKWANQDEGFTDVVKGIRKAVETYFTKEEQIHLAEEVKQARRVRVQEKKLIPARIREAEEKRQISVEQARKAEEKQARQKAEEEKQARQKAEHEAMMDRRYEAWVQHDDKLEEQHDKDMQEVLALRARRRLIIAVLMTALFLTLLLVPFDLPLHINIWGRIWRRLAEMGLVDGSILALLLTPSAILYGFKSLMHILSLLYIKEDTEDTEKTIITLVISIIALVPLIIAVACLLLLLFVIPLALTFWGQVFLIGLLIAFWLPLFLPKPPLPPPFRREYY